MDRWGYEERSQALLILKKHPRWIHTDVEVQTIHLCIEKTYDTVNERNLKEWCAKYSRSSECEKIKDTLKLCKKRIPKSHEAARAHLAAVIRQELERLQALLPALDAKHAAERELVEYAAGADDTPAGAVRRRYATSLERDYERTQKMLLRQIAMRDQMNNGFPEIVETNPIETTTPTGPTAATLETVTPDLAATPSEPPTPVEAEAALQNEPGAWVGCTDGLSTETPEITPTHQSNDSATAGQERTQTPD